MAQFQAQLGAGNDRDKLIDLAEQGRQQLAQLLENELHPALQDDSAPNPSVPHAQQATP